MADPRDNQGDDEHHLLDACSLDGLQYLDCVFFLGSQLHLCPLKTNQQSHYGWESNCGENVFQDRDGGGHFDLEENLNDVIRSPKYPFNVCEDHYEFWQPVYLLDSFRSPVKECADNNLKYYE